MRVLDRHEVRRPRRRRRARATTEISRSRSMNASSTASLAPERCPRRRAASVVRRDRAPALCRRSRSAAVFSTAGRPIVPQRRRARSSSLRTAANGVTGRPASRKKRLLAHAMLRDVRARGRWAARARAPRPPPPRPPSTFSNSNVTTSTPRANSRTASRSSYAATDFDVGDLSGRRVVLRARACGRGSPAGGRPSRTCGRAGRRRARRSSSRDGMTRRSRAAIATNRVGDLVAIGRAAARAARAATCARIATASSPALAAPAAPIATVATGTPFGICTIDSSESSPFSAALCTGTPITGSTVCAATMPGRCAAPPAPAMITSSPRSAAVGGVLGHPAPACGAPTRSGTRAARRTASAPRRPGASSPSPTGCP